MFWVFLGGEWTQTGICAVLSDEDRAVKCLLMNKDLFSFFKLLINMVLTKD
jgi:hypothetical protein